MQCRSHAAQLGRNYDELKRENFEVLLILGEPIEKARKYAESLHLPFPVLADPERKVYHLYGLKKVLLQRTASVIIDCNGTIQYFKKTTNPLVWLKESREVLEFIRSMAKAC